MNTIKRKPLVTSIETTSYGPSTESFSNGAPHQLLGKMEGTIHRQHFDIPMAPIRRQQSAGSRLMRSPTIVAVLVSFADVTLTVVPVIFLMLAFQALRLNGMPLDYDRGHVVEQAAKLGPSLFPIVFAAIIGRLMRTYALWRAERGSELGKLELLQGSQNLLATLERAIMLRGPGMMGLVVVLLWMLSPLGGQSSLRVLGTATRADATMSRIFYLNTTGDISEAGAFGGASALSSQGTTMRAVLSASLLSTGRTNGSDAWGNIRVPLLHRVPSYEAATRSTRSDVEVWYDFSEDQYRGPYSSLTGIVVNGLSPGVNTNFTMVTTYLNLTCSDRRVFPNYTLPAVNVTSFRSEVTEWTGGLVRTGNLTRDSFAPRTGSQLTHDSYFIDTNYNMSIDSSRSRRYQIIYASKGRDARNLTVFKCDTEALVVESQVFCTGLTCQLRRLRLSPTRRWWNGAFPFNTGTAVQYPLNLLGWASRATTSSSSSSVSPIDAYVSGVEDAFGIGGREINFSSVSNTQFSERLGSILNTAWQTGLQGAATAADPGQYNISSLAASLNSTTVAQSSLELYQRETATARSVILRDVYAAQYVWIAITIGVSFVLLGAGVASLYFKYSCPAPDILGYVSSMTRDNPNFGHVPGGDKMDGLARARVMREVKVQIVDGKPWDAEGHVTLRCLAD